MKTNREDFPLRFLYKTVPGRILLKVLACRGLSSACGHFLDSSFSRVFIPSFIRKQNINLSDYEAEEYASFNTFFYRKIRPELRPVASDPLALTAPCDGLLSAYKIQEGTVLPVKQSMFSISDLIGDTVPKAFLGGLCLVFRLCVSDYHRYCYFDSGTETGFRFLPGVLHTVRPIALESFPVFIQNCREVTFLDTENFGAAVQIEVGAMLVGKIVNRHPSGRFHRGEEKGRFEYGGSTVILLLKKDAAVLFDRFLTEAENGRETPVRLGEIIGRSCANK